ncbi:sulfatase-like hydrolase/transferase [Blastopirellula sp. JC732]|uniref:Sulfatase-like hydrolase/transferase n=1 Tax=Blastopirellula sediminis TaxID=2894196 RepID=A0A9X1SLD6_9BACT|nr:sulfatase-like hydrolase/transferase [Blastopirellula sediminis]MCC9606102.1 sulfatase-like hydrolase/transferase [Blastopirellula sediminis]MCC9630599.1 sulfatase-like hydrolase/transferase [Blastopirellula sediminis]
MRNSLSLACLTLLLAPLSLLAAETKRPNIILIMADDIGYECFGCYGSKQYQTPNIDRMAAGGMRFTHCYSQPLCTPSRVKLMTGLVNARNYSAFSVLNRDQYTFGHLLKEAGYRNMIAGKWQLYGSDNYAQQFRAKGTLPGEAGFDQWCLWQVDKLGERYDGPLLNINGENKQFENSKYGPDICVDHILEFIDQKSDQPFFVYYPMILVHDPFVPTPDSKKRDRKAKQRNFEDMVAYMDKLVGKIVDHVEQSGLADNTLILFVGDNGTNAPIVSELNGEKIKGGKGKTTDAGMRVPLVGYWPGHIPADKTCDDLVDFSDFFPTFADFAGVALPGKVDGQTFQPQLLGKPGTPREWFYCYYNPRPEKTKPVRFVRDQRWKLYDDGRLIDVANDVLEKHPIADLDATPGAKEAHVKLAAALKSMPKEGATLLKYPTGPAVSAKK